MEFHPTVKEYQKCPPGKKFRSLDNIEESKTILENPVNFTAEIERTVNNAQEVLSEVLEEVKRLEKNEDDPWQLRGAFHDFFDEWNLERWKKVHGT